MQNQQNQPPPGYPTESTPLPTEKKNKKMKCFPRSKPKGERGFIEGWIWTYMKESIMSSLGVDVFN
ncbi:hypothetical protein KY290_020994 [Solanum tuberosum]|uniref:Uncharacterized protein n=1 Tax=Solanum tuberosum TaxID=4113 RepID=A0ABQ7V0C8_SOLTU|nr:hypothetical protein KY289_020180 [Solanum tuberosum]KAH0692845.1 hypothetical protein KY285_019942 [Solanum tuberosum]KAH0757501.1 hypothetical protein KY290_020994 [Solanum tuberosum]